MRDDVQTLTEREKETLRFLLAGHDAKSIARTQDLSVHTVNERLRDARRKLNVSSSREAARLLFEVERHLSNSLGDKELGVVEPLPFRPKDEQPQSQKKSHALAWFGGGMLIMSIVVATLIASGALQGGGEAQPQLVTRAFNAATLSPEETAAADAANQWIPLVDKADWTGSWERAASIFKTQVTAEQWAAVVEPIRKPWGAVMSRELQRATATNSLPGAPAGDYIVLEFKSRLVGREEVVETVALTREGDAWKVAGYFMR